jgi:hypothetical protein
MVKPWLFRNFAAIGTFHWLGNTNQKRINEDHCFNVINGVGLLRRMP